MVMDSWELPPRLADAQVYDMSGYQQRRREHQIPQMRRSEDEDGPVAPVVDLDYTRARRNGEIGRGGPDYGAMSRSLRDIEPYDPAKHGGDPDEQVYTEPEGDLYNVGDQEALGDADFEQQDHSVWNRPVFNEYGEMMGTHTIQHMPGYRGADKKLKPWHLSVDDQTWIPFRSLQGAIAHSHGIPGQMARESAVFPDWTAFGHTSALDPDSQYLRRMRLLNLDKQPPLVSEQSPSFENLHSEQEGQDSFMAGKNKRDSQPRLYGKDGWPSWERMEEPWYHRMVRG